MEILLRQQIQKAKTETTSTADAEKKKLNKMFASAKAKTEANVDTATAEEVQEFMNDTDEKTGTRRFKSTGELCRLGLEGRKMVDI